MFNRYTSQKSPLRYVNPPQKQTHTTQRNKFNQHNNNNNNNNNNIRINGNNQPINRTPLSFPVNTNNYQQPKNEFNYQLTSNNNNYNNNNNHNYNNSNPNGRVLNDNEIGKLTLGVYETFKQNYNNYTPNYKEIYEIIKKNPPKVINGDSVLKIVQVVKQYYKEKENSVISFKETVKPQFNQDDDVKPSNVSVHIVPDKPNINQVIPANKIFEDNDKEFAQPPPKDGFVPKSEAKDLMTSSVDHWEYYVIIDSKDRDFERFPTPNNYVIDFAPSDYTSSNERKGYIRRGFHNVMSIELVSCLFLDSSGEPDSSDASGLPAYIMIEIPELSGDIHGTNTSLSNSFDMLTTFTAQGNYKYYNLPYNCGPSSMIKTYEPRISINKLTIKYVLPNGELYQFGQNNNSNANTVNQIILKIKQKKHSFNTLFLHKENS
jgi:hypothetical protein